MGWFAGIYDPMLAVVEAGFLRRWRAELCGGLEGRVLEIGAGTGLNAPHYPADLDLVFTEPSRAMRTRLERRTRSPVEPYPAEELPYPDASFDAVVSTLVLCSVRDLDRALVQVHRVLKPGGRLHFVEHVGADGFAGRVQRVLDPLWAPLAGGCHLCRRTPEAITRSGLTVERLEVTRPWAMPPFLHPVVRGVAVR